MNDAAVAPVLDALRRDADALFGDARATLEPIAIFDRPFSTIVRMRIVTPDSVPYYAYTKIYKVRPCPPYETPRELADVVRDEFAATVRLHQVLAGRPGLSSPRAIALLPEHRAIVTQELEGKPLDRVLRARLRGRGTPTIEAIATRIGAWLRAYQHLAPPAPTWSAAANRAYLDDRLRHIVPAVGERVRTEALRLLRPARGADGPPRRAARAHPCRPLPANILVTPDGGVAVLDFATAQAGTRYHDVAHLYLHLELVQQRRAHPPPGRRRGRPDGGLRFGRLLAATRSSA